VEGIWIIGLAPNFIKIIMQVPSSRKTSPLLAQNTLIGDPKIAEIIWECKRKNVYDIMGFAKSWNNEVVAQFYATCYFTTWKNDKIVHWMTEGKWSGITITEFAYLLGFDEEDLGRMKIHRDHYMDKVDMKFMYIPGQEWNFGRVNGMLPFYA
jgi:hypothetical protein